MKSNTDKALIDLQRHIYRESSATSGPLENVMPWLLDRRNLEAFGLGKWAGRGWWCSARWPLAVQPI